MSRHCDLIEAEEAAARYVAGRLPADEAAEFEEHLLGCDVCQARVMEAAELRVALRRSHSKRLLIPAVAVAAAVATVLLIRPSNIEQLGRVANAPAIATMDVRADADSAALLVTSGLRAYNLRDYERAASQLERGFALRPQTGTAFFLGAARLMAGHPDSAIAAFRYVIAQDDPAYGAEAHYYSAKAWLQLKNADSALTHLHAADRRGRALADSVRQLE